MKYRLTELDIRVIKDSLNVYLKQCEESIEIDDKINTLSIRERLGIEKKIKLIKGLLENM